MKSVVKEKPQGQAAERGVNNNSWQRSHHKYASPKKNYTVLTVAMPKYRHCMQHTLNL